MIGIAAGLTIGKIPLQEHLLTFYRKVYDQIRQSVAYSDKNVKFVLHMQINIRRRWSNTPNPRRH
jgi:transketolase C-terminal domain/subunit